MYTIEISNQQQSLPIDEAHLQEVVRRILAAEKVVEATISVALLDNEQIHALNRQYLDHDFPTDVLSFLLEVSPEPEGDAGEPTAAPRGAGKTLEGEILISAEMACDISSDFAWSPAEEVVLYLVHGLLHLCGYDDLSPDELEIMRAREMEMLKLFDLTPRYAGHADAESDRPTNRQENPGETP